jgi:hypothetical protein
MGSRAKLSPAALEALMVSAGLRREQGAEQSIKSFPASPSQSCIKQSCQRQCQCAHVRGEGCSYCSAQHRRARLIAFLVFHGNSKAACAKDRFPSYIIGRQDAVEHQVVE